MTDVAGAQRVRSELKRRAIREVCGQGVRDPAQQGKEQDSVAQYSRWLCMNSLTSLFTHGCRFLGVQNLDLRGTPV